MKPVTLAADFNERCKGGTFQAGPRVRATPENGQRRRHGIFKKQKSGNESLLYKRRAGDGEKSWPLFTLTSADSALRFHLARPALVVSNFLADHLTNVNPRRFGLALPLRRKRSASPHSADG